MAVHLNTIVPHLDDTQEFSATSSEDSLGESSSCDDDHSPNPHNGEANTPRRKTRVSGSKVQNGKQVDRSSGRGGRVKDLAGSEILSSSLPGSKYEQDGAQVQGSRLRFHSTGLYVSDEPNFGICFDIDGVLARGVTPIAAAKTAIRKLLDPSGTKLLYPVAFVTNALNTNQDKADQLSSWFGFTVTREQMIQSPTPLELFTDLHTKNCMMIGQGKLQEIATELGFKKLKTVEEVCRLRPMLDVVNHENRRRLTAMGTDNLGLEPFEPIEVILLLGEPKHWESSLQIIVDLLVTNGDPDRQADAQPIKQLPVVACNMDLRFMERSHMPRFGHGAFLSCLEALYEKITGQPLEYTALLGKPSEITYRYAEHVLAKLALDLNYKQPIKTMYFIGDNPASDITGSNLYQRYIDRKKHRQRRVSFLQKSRKDPELPNSRNFPDGTSFLPQTVETVESILVCSGVYKCPKNGEPVDVHSMPDHGHRDFPKIPELNLPTYVCKDANAAVDYILMKESVNS